MAKAWPRSLWHLQPSAAGGVAPGRSMLCGSATARGTSSTWQCAAGSSTSGHGGACGCALASDVVGTPSGLFSCARLDSDELATAATTTGTDTPGMVGTACAPSVADSPPAFSADSNAPAVGATTSGAGTPWAPAARLPLGLPAQRTRAQLGPTLG